MEAQQQLQGQQAVSQIEQQLQEYEQWFAHYQASPGWLHVKFMLQTLRSQQVRSSF